MKTYKIYIYQNAKEQGDVQDIIALKDGFNWYCFLFPMIWALYYRVWKFVFVTTLFVVAVYLFGKFDFISLNQRLIIATGLYAILGLYANDEYGKALLKKDYKFTDIVLAENKTQAILLYSQKNAR